MATEYDDAAHYAVMATGLSLTSSTAIHQRWSEITVAALRASGILSGMVDSTAPPSNLDVLWLDKNTDPGVLKRYQPESSSWVPVTYPWFRQVQDVVSYGVADIARFGGGPTATAAANTQAFETAQGYLKSTFGGGVVDIGASTITVGQSNSTATYENGGNYLSASNACLVVEPGISVRGAGVGATLLRPEDQTLQPIYAISPNGQYMQDFRIDGLWDGVTATSRSGILNVIPSDFGLTKLIDHDFSGGATSGWTAQGADVAITNASGNDLRVNYGGTYTGSGYITLTIPTVIGQQYRVRSPLSTDYTTPIHQWISVHASTGGVAGRYASAQIGEPISSRFAATFTFTATSATTEIHFSHEHPTQTDLQNTYFQISGVTCAQFSAADQMLWVRDFSVSRLQIENIGAYGLNIQDGDMVNVSVDNVRIKNTGGDGIDWKQRGPAADNYGLSVTNSVIEDACQTEDGTAALDLRGDINVSNMQVRGFGLAGFNTFGIRFRTLDSPIVAYGGDSARGGSLSGFYVYGGGKTHGLGGGVQIGAPNVSVGQGEVVSCFRGVITAGNTFGQAEASKINAVTAANCGTGFDLNVQCGQYFALKSVSCDTGFDNSGNKSDFHGCIDSNSTVPWVNTGPDVSMYGGNLDTGTFVGDQNGGTFTQLTSKTTAITIDRRCGRIVTHDGNLAAGASANFQVNVDPEVAFNSVFIPLVVPASDLYSARVDRITGTSFDVVVTNETGADSAIPVNLNFTILGNKQSN